MIRPVVRISPRQRDQFVDEFQRRARPEARRELEQIGVEWVEEVTRIVRDEFPRRNGERHKRNTTHLDQSFQARLNEGSDRGFPMRLELTVKPGVSAAKIATLNYGAKPHEIRAVNAKTLAWGETPGAIETPGQKVVQWKPGPKLSTPSRFMERARDRVLARRRRRG